MRTPSASVDDLLFRLRWFLLILVLPVVWIDFGNVIFPVRLLVWVVATIIFNMIVASALQTPQLAGRLPLPTLIVDTLLFALLPYTAVTSASLLSYFSVFPAMVAAIRFGPKAGMLSALFLSLSLGAHHLFRLLNSVRPDPLSTALPILAIIGVAVLTGYLTQREKEQAAKQAVQELGELRDAVAGAKLLYQTTDRLNLTASYKPVLESMLEAGVKGLPRARREDGPPIGLALLFDGQDPQQRLSVFASRNLERRDEQVRVSGKSGILAESFGTGDEIVFSRADADPELSNFGAFQRCRTGVCYPLRAGIELYGAVLLASASPRRPSDQHLELMRAFTSQAGIAFQNAKLYQASRQEQDRIIQSDNEMRQKLARDLHDGPTQKMAGLVMQLDYVRRLLESNKPEAQQEIEKARVLAQQATKEIRTALFTLRPLSLESKGLSVAVEQYGERLRETENVPIQVVPGDFGPELGLNVAMTTFAIIEEAIGNARKHGKNQPIFVSLQRKDNMLVATVQDQGPGFDVEQVESQYEKRMSLGLQHMRERTRLIDGNLSIVSAPGQGTRITLAVPIPPPKIHRPAS